MSDADWLEETEATHWYAWGNNPVRAKMKGRPCRIVARGALGTVLIEFTDGRLPESCTVSRRALRRLKGDRDELCHYREDEDGNWETSCEHMVCGDEWGGGPPTEWGWRWCPYCGRRIVCVPYHEPENEENDHE